MSKDDTPSHLEMALTNLREEAVKAGLMGDDERLIYERGSKTNGVAPHLTVGDRSRTCAFVPRFTLKTTQREAILMMEASYTTLRALRMGWNS